MSHILVTGGSGVLGRDVVRALLERGAQVTVFARGPAPAPTPGLNWVQGDLRQGLSLSAALRGVDTVLHAATVPQRPSEDLRLTDTVVQAAQAAGTGHLLYISIVGVDRLGAFPYYRAKEQGEQRVLSSGLPCTVVRATQFHEFVVSLLTRAARLPLLPLPAGLKLQPVEAGAVARSLADTALAEPAGRRELAGPEMLSLAELCRPWQAAGLRCPRPLGLPPVLPLLRELSHGALLSPSAERVGVTWADWLSGHAGVADPYTRRAAGSA